MIRLRIDINASSINDLKKTLRASILKLQGMGPGDSYILDDENTEDLLAVIAMWSSEKSEFEVIPSLEFFSDTKEETTENIESLTGFIGNTDSSFN